MIACVSLQCTFIVKSVFPHSLAAAVLASPAGITESAAEERGREAVQVGVSQVQRLNIINFFISPQINKTKIDFYVVANWYGWIVWKTY